MTHRAARFHEANKQSPVVYGSVVCLERGGAFYRLADGRTFELTAAEHRMIEPRWAFEGADA